MRNLLTFLFSWKGRVNRRQLALSIVCYLSLVIAISFANFGKDLTADLIICVVLLGSWCMLVLQIKRWHDMNLPGYCVLWNIIPVIPFLILLFAPGSKGSNRCGS